MKKTNPQQKDQDRTTQGALRLMLGLMGLIVGGICLFFALTFPLHVR
ncbi:hypothetical protein LC612_35355 [Nostoc sp. CHAB 5834]|nr:hypothetical protein [Nostoc sp. CHAB 5834]